MRLILRWLITSLGLGAAVLLVPGITVEGDAALYVAATAVILGLVNALVRPLLRLLSFPFILVTLGLFLFVINAFTLWLSAWIAATYLDIPFTVDGFVPALLGGIIVSVVSWLLSALMPDLD
ncbi:MAG TPA: phage holin family protein [Anaerolineales bacterium]|nr:phage holin family protein [Anaerolineales bacterium]